MTIRVAIETHGCKLNQAESDTLARRLASAGCQVVGPRDSAEMYLLNTCTVTHVADAKARQALRAARRRNPEGFIIAMGCYARRAPQELYQVEGVDLVVDQSSVEQAFETMATLARHQGQKVPSSACQGSPALPYHARTRAMVKIQEGCLQSCAYCVVPQVRGRARSVPPDAVVSEVKQRVEEGYREVVLTGTQPGCYGADIGPPLAQLLRRLLNETRIDRIRVSSLQAQEIDPELLELWKDPRLCPHLHMPLQSGSASVLRRMGRRYTSEQYLNTIQMLRTSVPQIAITTDSLVGFPGESEAEAAESLHFMERVGFAAIHVFPYSPRPGTRAARMVPQVPPSELAKRMIQMLSLAHQTRRQYLRASLGQVRPVLWEEARRINGAVAWSGLTDNYLRVFAFSAADLLNHITKAQLLEERNKALWVKVVGAAT